MTRSKSSSSSSKSVQFASIKDRVLNTLRRGRSRRKSYTARQLVETLDLSSTDAVYATISQLRKDGHEIKKKTGNDGYVRYAI